MFREPWSLYDRRWRDGPCPVGHGGTSQLASADLVEEEHDDEVDGGGGGVGEEHGVAADVVVLPVGE